MRLQLQVLAAHLSPQPFLRPAAASSPAVIDIPHSSSSSTAVGMSPWEWGAAQWARLEHERKPIFDEEALARQLDRKAFLRDGFVVLEGIMTPNGRTEWTRALQHGQDVRDAFLREDWRRTVDWAALGRPAPPKSRVGAEALAVALGCTQAPPGTEEACGTISLKTHGLIPEYFPAGHVPFLMDVLTHPQMLRLHRALLGSERICLDHSSLLNRKAGYKGGNFHSHSMTGRNWDRHSVLDGGGTPATVAEYDAQPNYVISLCYPEGFEAQDDGGLMLM
jgi:hypothetical protein